MTIGNLTLEAASKLCRDWDVYTLTDLGPSLTCKEVESLAELLEATGHYDKRCALMDSHAAGDTDEDDWHQGNPVPLYARAFDDVFPVDGISR